MIQNFISNISFGDASNMANQFAKAHGGVKPIQVSTDCYTDGKTNPILVFSVTVVFEKI
ncbi:protein of unknown function [Tenacibaculum sp. 190130A14a]|uniref:Uncharacterized protein n=1 Tax=Tenacibaculum polynesiense TaxID=3137857 RepID=A0ABM9P6S3_9FLAO